MQEVIISTVSKFAFAIIGFGILVFFHELGHFVIGKLFKLTVEVFSIGWGHTLWSFYYKGTTYKICLLPLGGYCKFKNDEISEDIPLIIRKTEFNYLKSKVSEADYEKLYQSYIPSELSDDEYEKLLTYGSEIKNDINQCYDFVDTAKYYRLKEGELPQLQVERILRVISKNLDYLESFKLSDKIDEKEKKELNKKIKKSIKVFMLRSSDGFYGLSPIKRILIAAAGPFMNYILAVVFLTLLFATPHQRPLLPAKIYLSDDISNLIGLKKENESPAKKYGLKTGDILKSINGLPVNSFSDMQKIVIMNKENELKIVADRNGEQVNITLKPDWDPTQMRPIIGVYSYSEPIIFANDKTKLSNYLKLYNGDIITRIDDIQDNLSGEVINSYIRNRFSKNLTSTLYILRGLTNEITVEIDFNTINNYISEKDFYFQYKPIIEEVAGEKIHTAIKSAFLETADTTSIVLNGLYSLIFKPKKNVMNQIGGPIKIGAIIGEATYEGLSDGLLSGLRVFINILAYLSLALCIFNLLPFPAIDGGHIIIYLYELIFRKQVSLKILYIINMTGFLILIVTAVLIAFFDITGLMK